MVAYAVIIEAGTSSYAAWVPDLPGCIAAAATEDEALSLIREAIEMHIKALREDGEPVPEPRSRATTVAVGV